MKIKVDLLQGETLDNCSMLNLYFIEDKVLGVASFTNEGCFIKTYGNTNVVLNEMLCSGLYAVLKKGILDVNEFGECFIIGDELLGNVINYVKDNIYLNEGKCL